MKESRMMTYLIAGLLTLLLGACLLAMTLQSAGMIRETLLGECAAQFASDRDRVQSEGTLPEGAAARERQWNYLQLLRQLRSDTGYSRDVTTVNYFLGSAPGETALGDRNMLLATLMERDGTVEYLPIAFRQDGTADVIALLHNPGGVSGSGWTTELTGFWENGLFVLTRLSHQSAGHPEQVDYAFTEYEDWAQMETYRVPGGAFDGREHLTLEVLEKNPGSHGLPEYAARYRRANDLLAYIKTTSITTYPVDECYPWENTLYRVTVLGNVNLRDPDAAMGGGSIVHYIYGATFSPLALAWRECLRSGMFWLLLAVYAGVMAVLLYAENALRQGERRRYQDEIQRQELALNYARDAEQSRREMTSAIAHELKTPIAVLASYAEALQENIDAEKQAHYLSVIRDETGRMDRMVLELLDLSRLEAGKYKLRRENFDLEELAREVIAPLEPQLREKDVKLEWRVDQASVHADPARIAQVLENFMTNAIRHTPQGGTILLRIGGQGETFSVENRGRPIPPEQLPKVWETFWQGDASRNERGSGLGLAICRTIVELHGGSCKAENTAAGVRFSVSLDRNTRLYQLGRMPQEPVIALDYPLVQWYTTVERVMTHLGLLSARGLRQELREGSVKLGADTVRDRKQKLYPGYVLSWREYRITIRQDETEKRNAMMMDRMRSGSLGNQDMIKNGGYTVGGF